MKKTKFVFSIIVVIFSLLVIVKGVNFYKEERERNALKSQAIYNAFGYDGYAYDSVWIEETDDKGRILYGFSGYNEATFSGLVHYMVCQYIDYKRNYVYYYPIDNIFTYRINEDFIFSFELANNLKEKNDWNKEIDLSKCVKRKIDKYKDIDFNKVEIEKIFEEYILSKYEFENVNEVFTYRSKCWLLDIDKKGLELYAYKCEDDTYEEYVFALILDSNDRSKYDIFEIFYDETYNQQIESFKLRNNWAYNYCP